jgi:hypothetical protein
MIDKLLDKLKNATYDSPFSEKEIKSLINNKSKINSRRNIFMFCSITIIGIAIIAAFAKDPKPHQRSGKHENLKKITFISEPDTSLKGNTYDFDTTTKPIIISLKGDKALLQNKVIKKNEAIPDSVQIIDDVKVTTNNIKEARNYMDPHPEGNYKNMGDFLEVRTDRHGYNNSPFNFGEVSESRVANFTTNNNLTTEKYSLSPINSKQISAIDYPELNKKQLENIGITLTDSSFVWPYSYNSQILKYDYKRQLNYKNSREITLLVKAGYPVGVPILIQENLELLFNPYFEKMIKPLESDHPSKDYSERLIHRDFQYRKNTKAFKVRHHKVKERIEPILVEYKIGDRVSYLLNFNERWSNIHSSNLNDLLSSYNYKLIPVKYIDSDFGNLKDITFWYSPSKEFINKLPNNYLTIIENEFSNNCRELDQSVTQTCRNVSPNINSYNLYPIPANNFIWLELNTKDEILCEVNIFDLSGNQVGSFGKHLFKNQQNKQFIIKKLKPGLYNLNLITDKGDLLNLKFIKK